MFTDTLLSVTRGHTQWLEPLLLDLTGDGWRLVGLGKVSSWSLLVIVTFILVADLKHIKAQRDRR